MNVHISRDFVLLLCRDRGSALTPIDKKDHHVIITFNCSESALIQQSSDVSFVFLHNVLRDGPPKPFVSKMSKTGLRVAKRKVGRAFLYVKVLRSRQGLAQERLACIFSMGFRGASGASSGESPLTPQTRATVTFEQFMSVFQNRDATTWPK